MINLIKIKKHFDFLSAPLVLRTCVKDIEIQGVKFRKNTYVAIPVYTLHRNPEAFEKPEEFYPEHFK